MLLLSNLHTSQSNLTVENKPTRLYTSQHQQRTNLCHHTIIKVCCIFQLCRYKSIPQIPSIPGTIKELSRNMHHNKRILHISKNIRALSLKHYLLQLGISSLDNIKGTSQHQQRTKLLLFYSLYCPFSPTRRL